MLSAVPEADTLNTLPDYSLDTGRQLKVAYVMSRFPKLSETFILYEMLALQRQRVNVSVYPLVLERAATSHAEAAQLLAQVRHTGALSGALAGAVLHFMRQKPGTLLGVTWQVMRATFAPKRAYLASLATIPRAVWMAREMQREGVTHVHAHFATHATTAALVVKRLTGIPFSFTAHAQDIYVQQRMLREKIEDAEFVATISQFNQCFLADYVDADAQSKVHVVHCGVDTELFRPGDMPAPGEQFKIVCVGRLIEMKGQAILIEACRLLQARGIAFSCTLIGDGEDRAALEQQIAEGGLADSVRLLGGQPRDVVLETLRGASVVVLPAIVTQEGRMEGIPVALMEALACQRAVVATRISGIPELITDGENGLLIEPGSAKALADVLARLEADPELRNALGQAGRQTVLAEFDLEANAARLLGLITAVHTSAPTRTDGQ